jgi:diacylglycerol kinase (ATP)
MSDRPTVTKEQLSLVKRAKSFSHAGRGLWLFVRTTPNAWIHLVLFVVAIGLGLWFQITLIEWALLTLVGTFVLAAEAFNTAIEIDIDLTSPEYHPYARDTKDVAAGAVLISALAAVVIGMLIFGRYLL